MTRRLALVFLVLLGTVACKAKLPPGQKEAVGIITVVEEQEGRITSITLEAENAPTIKLATPTSVDYGFDLRHLFIHRDQHLPVLVRYELRKGQPVALSILDASR